MANSTAAKPAKGKPAKATAPAKGGPKGQANKPKGKAKVNTGDK